MADKYVLSRRNGMFGDGRIYENKVVGEDEKHYIISYPWDWDWIVVSEEISEDRITKVWEKHWYDRTERIKKSKCNLVKDMKV